MPIAKGTKQNKGNELYILLADCSGKMPRVDLKTSISSPDSRYLQFYDIKRTMDLSQASRHFLRLLDVVVMARSALELCIFKVGAATFSGKSRANAPVKSSCAHPPPPGNCGEFARIVSPGGRALANPRATPGLLTHTWFLTRNPNEDDFIGKDQ